MPRPIPTADEIRQLRESVMLPMLLTIFQRDLDAINAVSAIKTKSPYADLLAAAMNAVMRDLADVKRSLSRAGIRIVEEKRGELDLTVVYTYRGYHEKQAYMWSWLGAEIEARMRRYLAEAGPAIVYDENGI